LAEKGANKTKIDSEALSRLNESVEAITRDVFSHRNAIFTNPLNLTQFEVYLMDRQPAPTKKFWNVASPKRT